jgi:hypothetical protein
MNWNTWPESIVGCERIYHDIASELAAQYHQLFSVTVRHERKEGTAAVVVRCALADRPYIEIVRDQDDMIAGAADRGARVLLSLPG